MDATKQNCDAVGGRIVHLYPAETLPRPTLEVGQEAGKSLAL